MVRTYQDCSQIVIEAVPPPEYVQMLLHTYSAFFLGAVVLLGFATVSSAAAAGVAFLVEVLFNLAFSALLRLELP